MIFDWIVLAVVALVVCDVSFGSSLLLRAIRWHDARQRLVIQARSAGLTARYWSLESNDSIYRRIMQTLRPAPTGSTAWVQSMLADLLRIEPTDVRVTRMEPGRIRITVPRSVREARLNVARTALEGQLPSSASFALMHEEG